MDKQILEKHLSCVVKYLVGQVGHGISTGLHECVLLIDFSVLRVTVSHKESAKVYQTVRLATDLSNSTSYL